MLWSPCGCRKQQVGARVSFSENAFNFKGEHNLEYVLLVSCGQVRERLSSTIDFIFYFFSKKLPYVKLLVRPCYWISSFAFHPKQVNRNL